MNRHSSRLNTNNPIREDQIAYETGTHWVLEIQPGRFEVYKSGVTHSIRCAQIGPYPEPGRAKARAIEECDRRSGMGPTEVLTSGKPDGSGRFPLSAQARERLQLEQSALQRIYHMETQDLAFGVLSLARQARAYCQFGPEDSVYDSQLLWRAIPELARRLGVRETTPEEQSTHWARLSDSALRARLASCLFNASDKPTITPSGGSRNPWCWSLLMHTPCNGNPVAMAMDRLCPPNLEDRQDPLVRHMLEVGALRGQSGAMWSPDWMLQRPDDREEAASDLTPETTPNPADGLQNLSEMTT